MPDRSKPRGRPKTLDRQRTVEVAMESYWREGLHALSLNEVCRRTGVSKPGLYREFGGEDGLMRACLEHYREVVVAPTFAMLSADRPFAEAVEALIVWMTEPRDTPPGCLFTEMRLSRWRIGPETEAGVDAIRSEMRRTYEEVYRRALARGEVDPSISVETAGFYLETLLTTVLVQLGAGETPPRVREQALLALGRLAVG
jgi:AcrR family transcriptional regulator